MVRGVADLQGFSETAASERLLAPNLECSEHEF